MWIKIEENGVKIIKFLYEGDNFGQFRPLPNVPNVPFHQYIFYSLCPLIFQELVFFELQLSTHDVLSPQLPVVLSLMARVGIVTHQSLRRFRKYAIVIAFLAAAFLTPPDPFSQLSLALPIVVLYEISIYIAKLIQKNKDDKK